MKIQQFTRFVYFTNRDGSVAPVNPSYVTTWHAQGDGLTRIYLTGRVDLEVKESAEEVTRKLEEATAMVFTCEGHESSEHVQSVVDQFRSLNRVADEQRIDHRVNSCRVHLWGPDDCCCKCGIPQRVFLSDSETLWRRGHEPHPQFFEERDGKPAIGTALEDSKPIPGTDQFEPIKPAIGNAPASR